MKQQIKVKTEWSLDGHVGTIKTDVAGQVTRKVIDLQDQAMAEMLNAAGWYKREEPTTPPAPKHEGYEDPVVCNSSEAEHLWDSGKYDGYAFKYMEGHWGLILHTGGAQWHKDCNYALYRKKKKATPPAPKHEGYEDPVVVKGEEAQKLWDSGEYDGWITFFHGGTNGIGARWGGLLVSRRRPLYYYDTYALYKKEVKPQKTTIEDLYNEEKGQFAWLYRKNGFIEQANPELYDGEWEMSEEKTISDLANAGVRYTFNPFLSYEEATPIT